MKTAILVIVIAWGGYAPRTFQYDHQTMDLCLKALEKTIIVNPPSGDNEWIGFATCKNSMK